jgi:hypothetical protein
LQEKFVYVPVIPGLTRTYEIKPSRFNLPYENVPLVAQDGTNVHGWLIRPQGIPHNPGGRHMTTTRFSALIRLWASS